jgi:hypothetical protein
MKAPSWQIDRATRLHGEFVALARAIECENAQLVRGLQEISARLDGTPLKTPPGKKPKLLKATLKTLTTCWYQWTERGRKASALIPKYKSPAHVERMPDELAREIQIRATKKYGGRDKHQKGIDATTLHKFLATDWRAGKPLPGLGTWQQWWAHRHPGLPAPLHAPDFPWSVKTVSRRMGPKALLKMGNLGHAAALKHLPSMQRDYSQLRKCELYTLDDVQLDLVAIDDLTGKTGKVTCYILQEIASRCIVAFVLKPANSIKAEDVDELLAWGLQAEGFGIGDGYPTHIWFERGTIACSEAAQRALEGCSDGGIIVHRTSMDGGITWIGTAADKASGHSAGKATIESFNRKLHNRLIHLPGQRGNKFENAPANLGLGDKQGRDPSKRRAQDTVVSYNDMIGQAKLTALVTGTPLDLKATVPWVSELREHVRHAIADYNHERGHHMQGFHKITEAEIAPGVWQEVA